MRPDLIPPLSRRRLLAGAAATVALPAVRAFGNVVPAVPGADGFVVLEARPGERQIRPAPGPKTPIWGYGGDVPGPLIRARRGERVKVRLKNGLSQPTSLHWHGVRLANAMDGAAGLTQAPVAPGASFDYDFVPPDAGTFWYHPHIHPHTAEQLERGLHGVLIVDEPEPVQVDKDIFAVVDDWRLEPDGTIDARFDNPADMTHAGRLGNVLTVNAVGREHTEALPPNARVRVRLVNVSNARVFDLRFEGAEFLLVAVDGQPSTPFIPKGAKARLPPGGRFDVMLDLPGKPGEEARIMAAFPNGAVPLVTLRAEGDPVAARPPIAPLAANPLPARIDLARARRFDLLMEGGVDMNEQGPRHMQAMTNPTKAWTFNGKAMTGHEPKPFFSVRRGAPVVLALINKTAWPHAMHLHGHHFRTLFAFDDGWDPYWLDTALVERGQTLRVAFVADNPGKWMLHCHMIEHQAAGMSTWFEVT